MQAEFWKMIELSGGDSLLKKVVLKETGSKVQKYVDDNIALDDS